MSEDKDKGEGESGAKKAKPKRLTVVIVRAVDAYHHRNRVINVPDDEYHQSLLRQGNLRKVED